ncbi:MAG: hypothetical protein ACRDH8_01545 [Actinomycetota bacterium]
MKRATKLRLPKLSLRSFDPRPLFRGPRLPWTLFVLALAGAVTLGALWWSEQREDSRRSEVEATAGRFLVALTNFSGETIERDIEEIRSFAIGQFAEEVDQTFTPERVQQIQQNEATSSGEVQSLFVQSIDEASATVFAVVNETVSNATQQTPRTDVLRIEIALIETAESWKVSRVEILQSPQGGLV